MQKRNIVKLLLKKNLTISVCESCTGGLLANLITNVSGSSNYFKGAIVAYSNYIKEKIVGIKKELIEKYGAVSKEVALEMAKNIKKIFRTDIGISITGIAGPRRIENKPRGEVYIGLAIGRKFEVKKFNFKGKREEIKYKATTAALELLEKKLKSI